MGDNQLILFHYALSMVGKPYIWGGDNALQGFDCSGLVIELLKAIGAAPPSDTTAQGIYNHFKTNCTIGSQNFGALCFYGKSLSEITHIGFLLSENLMIEAGGGGSKITTIGEALRADAVVRVRPVNFRRDLVCVIRPKYELI
jgi:cell wall-associated NlpC family hydrolase